MTDLVTVALIAAAPGMVTALLSGINLWSNRKNRKAEKAENEANTAAMEAYHKEVNNKMDEFIKVVKKDSHAEGKLEGAAEANLKEKHE